MLLTYSWHLSVFCDFKGVKKNDGHYPILKLQTSRLTLISVKAQIPWEGFIQLFTL